MIIDTGVYVVQQILLEILFIGLFTMALIEEDMNFKNFRVAGTAMAVIFQLITLMGLIF